MLGKRLLSEVIVDKSLTVMECCRIMTLTLGLEGVVVGVALYKGRVHVCIDIMCMYKFNYSLSKLSWPEK